MSIRRHCHDFRIPHGGLFAFLFGVAVVVRYLLRVDVLLSLREIVFYAIGNTL